MDFYQPACKLSNPIYIKKFVYIPESDQKSNLGPYVCKYIAPIWRKVEKFVRTMFTWNKYIFCIKHLCILCGLGLGQVWIMEHTWQGGGRLLKQRVSSNSANTNPANLVCETQITWSMSANENCKNLLVIMELASAKPNNEWSVKRVRSPIVRAWRRASWQSVEKAWEKGRKR